MLAALATIDTATPAPEESPRSGAPPNGTTLPLVSSTHPATSLSALLAGAIMAKAGITRDIVDVMRAVVGKAYGGLAIVTILSCMFFARRTTAVDFVDRSF